MKTRAAIVVGAGKPREVIDVNLDGDPIQHYTGTSTFTNHTVLPEIALAKLREDAPFGKICYIGCGVATGIGAVINTAKIEVNPMITHTMALCHINKGFDLTHSDESIRLVVNC